MPPVREQAVQRAELVELGEALGEPVPVPLPVQAVPALAEPQEQVAEGVLGVRLPERLVVPEQAVLYAGERSFVFVDLGDGRLEPTEVETGLVTGDEIEILSGLSEGEPVVTSGNFLIAAESRLKLAMEQWR